MTLLFVLLAPVSFVLAALLAMGDAAGRRRASWASIQAAGAVSVLLALAAFALALARGPLSASLAVWHGAGISVRLDVLGTSLFLLVAFIGVIVLRYSRTYLEGDPRRGLFLGELCLTLAAVMTLMVAGNLALMAAAWIATSLALHRLLLFYPERDAARRAARRKFIVARTGDACILGAFALLAWICRSADLAVVLEHVHAMDHAGPALSVAAVLLVLAAALKSAQFPAHGWLPDIIDTPTPVSALLHAGIVNGGGFLAIRFAEVLVAVPAAMHLLAAIGAISAVYGSLVMLTQTSIKASLAWSTIAQMGLMLLECGLGAFPLALLHLIAHSFYKAHGFLASGTAVDAVARRRAAAPATAGPARALGPVLAIVLYLALRPVMDRIADEPAATRALGLLVAIGAGMLLARATPAQRPGANLARGLLLAAVAMLAYAALHAITGAALGSSVPAAPAASWVTWAILVPTLIAFAVIALMQLLPERLQARPGWRAAYVHLSQSLYVDALLWHPFDHPPTPRIAPRAEAQR
ncbi:MAG TPA: proton-conducting transporter membrane subunit [Dyella sp.]|nr:proton-conducting transporter membrane subunit [Dyella sp.]